MKRKFTFPAAGDDGKKYVVEVWAEELPSDRFRGTSTHPAKFAYRTRSGSAIEKISDTHYRIVDGNITLTPSSDDSAQPCNQRILPFHR